MTKASRGKTTTATGGAAARGKLTLTKASDGTVALGGGVGKSLRSKLGDKAADSLAKAAMAGKKLNSTAMKALLVDSKNKTLSNAMVGFAEKNTGSKGFRLTVDGKKISMQDNTGKKPFVTKVDDLKNMAGAKNLITKASRAGQFSIKNPAKSK